MSNIIEKCIEIKITIHQEQTHKSQGGEKKSQEYGAPTDFTPSAGAPYGRCAC